jgi:hypothetical protein
MKAREGGEKGQKKKRVKIEITLWTTHPHHCYQATHYQTHNYNATHTITNKEKYQRGNIFR